MHYLIIARQYAQSSLLQFATERDPDGALRIRRKGAASYFRSFVEIWGVHPSYESAAHSLAHLKQLHATMLRREHTRGEGHSYFYEWMLVPVSGFVATQWEQIACLDEGTEPLYMPQLDDATILEHLGLH